jgi:hypothetical protein
MKKLTLSSSRLSFETTNTLAFRSFTPVSSQFNRLLTPTALEENPGLLKLFSNSKKYSILAVPSPVPLKDLKIRKEEKNIENFNKSGESFNQIKFPDTKKISFAKIKKIRRSYRPQNGVNEENLKNELKRLEEIQVQKNVLMENSKVLEKSDIEKLLESQKSWKKNWLRKNDDFSYSQVLKENLEKDEKNLDEKFKENFREENLYVERVEVKNKTPKSRIKEKKRTFRAEKNDYKQESWKVLKNTAFFAEKIMKGIRNNAKIKFISLY